MCFVEILALAMLIGGIVALITGKVQLTKDKIVTGGKARIIGGIMVATLPLVFVAAFAVGFILAMSSQDEEAITGIALAVSLLVFVACVILTVVLLVTWAQPVRQQHTQGPPLADLQHPSPYPPQGSPPQHPAPSQNDSEPTDR